MTLTPEQEARLRGAFIIRCVKPGGYTMDGYAQYTWTTNEQQDLLGDGLPTTLRAADYHTARTMCLDPARELAQAIVAGDFIIIEQRPPDESVLLERPRG